jgi:hypothetical protein
MAALGQKRQSRERSVNGWNEVEAAIYPLQAQIVETQALSSPVANFENP